MFLDNLTSFLESTLKMNIVYIMHINYKAILSWLVSLHLKSCFTQSNFLEIESELKLVD